MSKKKKKPGPKPLPVEKRRSEMYSLRMTMEEKQQASEIPADEARDRLLGRRVKKRKRKVR